VPKSRAAREVGVSKPTAYRILQSYAPALAVGASPFSANPVQGPSTAPAPAWATDQPPPSPTNPTFASGYHGHTYRSFAAPLSFADWDLGRIRSAVLQHRMGIFLESSTLSMVLMGFPPVFAAISQRMATHLNLPRRIRYGSRGLSRVLGDRLTNQLAPTAGSTPSPYWPSTLWGASLFERIWMGFYVLQHAYSEPDADGVRMCYTRRWPTWATQYYRYRKTYVALTHEGPVDILNDGKFTLVADTDEPHLTNACVLPLAEECFDGKSTQRARASYIDKYGNPKWVAEMPPGVAPNSPEGEAMYSALATIRGPDGFGMIPNGTKVDIHGLEQGRSTVMADALGSNVQFIAAVILGQDATLMRGSVGVYTSPMYNGVRLDIISDDVQASIRGCEEGHVRPWLNFNYAASIAEARSWQQPQIEIPLPDPDAETRMTNKASRMIKVCEISSKERAAGFLVNQERVNQIADELEVVAPSLEDPTGKTAPPVVIGENTSQSYEPESGTEPEDSRDKPDIPTTQEEDTTGGLPPEDDDED
jgi:hypothetical protein